MEIITHGGKTIIPDDFLFQRFAPPPPKKKIGHWIRQWKPLLTLKSYYRFWKQDEKL